MGRVSVALAFGAACSSSGTKPPPAAFADSAVLPADVAAAPAADSAPAAVIDPALAAQARVIAAEYQAWGRVDDDLRWAPGLCRIPLPGVARMSASDDVATHGQKLYSVFAKNQKAYPLGPHLGQVVVKESWTAERVTDPSVMYDPEKWRDYPDGGDHFYPYAKKGDEIFRAGQRAGLYIMMRLEDGAPNTDDGWVYATITAAGEVTAAGRVSSCMGCHIEADHERLFGVPRSPVF
jgi:hypothetical protein